MITEVKEVNFHNQYNARGPYWWDGENWKGIINYPFLFGRTWEHGGPTKAYVPAGWMLYRTKWYGDRRRGQWKLEPLGEGESYSIDHDSVECFPKLSSGKPPRVGWDAAIQEVLGGQVPPIPVLVSNQLYIAGRKAGEVPPTETYQFRYDVEGYGFLAALIYRYWMVKGMYTPGEIDWFLDRLLFVGLVGGRVAAIRGVKPLGLTDEELEAMLRRGRSNNADLWLRWVPGVLWEFYTGNSDGVLLAGVDGAVVEELAHEFVCEDVDDSKASLPDGTIVIRSHNPCCYAGDHFRYEGNPCPAVFYLGRCGINPPMGWLEEAGLVEARKYRPRRVGEDSDEIRLAFKLLPEKSIPLAAGYIHVFRGGSWGGGDKRYFAFGFPADGQVVLSFQNYPNLPEISGWYFFRWGREISIQALYAWWKESDPTVGEIWAADLAAFTDLPQPAGETDTHADASNQLTLALLAQAAKELEKVPEK